MEETLKLVFVKDVGKNQDVYDYDFYFSYNPDDFWGIGFDCEFANQDTPTPDKKTYDEVLRLKTTIPLFCIQHNRCFSMSHVVDGILSVAFEDITDYEEYPEPYRLVFKYGEAIYSVEEKLSGRHQFFNNQEPDI